MRLRQNSVFLMVVILLAGCERTPLRALGTLEWDRVNGRAIASETITDLLVKEGDSVSIGQALLVMDSGLQQSRVLQTQARIEQLKWQLLELEAGYRTEQVAAAEAEYIAAQSTRKNREAEVRRMRTLVKDKLVSQRAVDLAETALDQAIGQEEATLERLTELRAGFRTEKIKQAAAALEAEQASLAYQEQLLSRYTIRAERAGILESFPFKLGDKPPAGAVVTTVLSGASPWARVYLPEPWLGLLSVGSLVDVFVDGSKSPMEGRIRHIESRSSFTPYYALAEEDRQRLSYVTQIDLLAKEATDLPVGIPVQVGLRN